MSETFSGSVLKDSFSSHPFTVAQVGTVSVTLTGTNPLATITLGLGISQASGGVCQTSLLAYNDAARTGTVLSGTAGAGSYCAYVYDVGNVVDSVTYTLTIDHY